MLFSSITVTEQLNRDQKMFIKMHVNLSIQTGRINDFILLTFWKKCYSSEEQCALKKWALVCLKYIPRWTVFYFLTVKHQFLSPQSHLVWTSSSLSIGYHGHKAWRERSEHLTRELKRLYFYIIMTNSKVLYYHYSCLRYLTINISIRVVQQKRQDLDRTAKK